MKKKYWIILLFVVLMMILWYCTGNGPKPDADIEITCNGKPGFLDTELNQAFKKIAPGTTVRIGNLCHIDRPLVIAQDGVRVFGMDGKGDENGKNKTIISGVESEPVMIITGNDVKISDIGLEKGKLGAFIYTDGAISLDNVSVQENTGAGICIIGPRGHQSPRAPDYRKKDIRQKEYRRELTECDRFASEFEKRMKPVASSSVIRTAVAQEVCTGPVNTVNQIFSNNNNGPGVYVSCRNVTLTGANTRITNNKRGAVVANNGTLAVQNVPTFRVHGNRIGGLSANNSFLVFRGNTDVWLQGNGAEDGSRGGLHAFDSGTILFRGTSKVTLKPGSPNEDFDFVVQTNSVVRCLDGSSPFDGNAAHPTRNVDASSEFDCPLP